MRISKLRAVVSAELDSIAVLVNITMVVTTQQSHIIEASFAAFGPVVNMMPFQEDSMSAARKDTRRVTLEQRSLDRASDGTALTSDRQRHTVFVFVHFDHTGIATEPTCGLHSKARVAHTTHIDGIGCPVAQGARRDRDHHLDSRTIRPVTTQVSLCDRDQCVSAIECALGCIGALVQRTHLSHRARFGRSGEVKPSDPTRRTAFFRGIVS